MAAYYEGPQEPPPAAFHVRCCRRARSASGPKRTFGVTRSMSAS